MARAHFVKKARKDNPVVSKGESYWWWQFRFGPKRYSATQPRASQLTQSEFLGTIYGLQEQIEDLKLEDDWKEQAREFVESLKGDIEEAGSTVEDNLSNMPEGLQEGDTGQMMQERIDACEQWASELEGLDPDDYETAEDFMTELEGMQYEGE